MKNYQKGFSLIVILLVIAVIGIVGSVTYYVNKVNEDAPLNNQNYTEENSTSKIPALDATPKPEDQLPDDYENFENQEIGFKYSYPKTWISYDDGGAAEFLHKKLIKSPDHKTKVDDRLERSEAGGRIFIRVHASDFQTTEDFKAKAQDFDFSSAEDVMVGGVTAVRDAPCGDPKVELICTVLVKNGYYYQINYAYSIGESPSGAKYLDVYKNILDSFRFTK